MATKKTNKKDDSSAPEKDKPSKLFDVAKPGETPASATSRPIIVSHSSMIKKDPMVREPIESQDEESDAEHPKPLQSHAAPAIKPLEEKEVTDSKLPEEEAAKEAAPEQAIENNDKEVKSSGEDESIAVEKPAESEKPEGGEVEKLAGEVTAKREEQKKKEEEAAKIQEIEKVIESKEFFVPIGQVSRRRSTRRGLVALIILLVVVAVGINFAIDSEVLDLGFNSLTDLL